MARGRQTKRLAKEQIRLLEEFRTSPHQDAAGGYSVTALHKAMRVPFSTETLGKALRGLPIWDLSHSWLTSWIERYLVVRHGKDGSDGDSVVTEKGGVSMSQNAVPGAVAAESLSEEVLDETAEPDEKGTGTTRTVRGSR